MERLAGRVYTLARFSLSNASDAEDVTQEVFTRLWENWRQIDLDRVEGWLVRATSNACVDFKRRRAARRNREGFTPLVAEAPDPSAALVSSETRAHVAAAIAQLEDPFRSILILREIEGLPYQQIGQILGLSLTQVKVYLHRARARLTPHLVALSDERDPVAPPRKGAVHAS